MEILHLLSQRPDSTGSGIYLQAMIREAASQGHGNSLLCAINGRDLSCLPELPCSETAVVSFASGNLRYPLPGMSDVMPYPSSRFKDLSEEQIELYEGTFLACLQGLLKRKRVDIIHSHHLWLLSSLVKKHFSHIPMVTSCHGSDLRQFQICSHLHPRVTKGCTLIDRVFALTTLQKQQISSLYGIAEANIVVTGAGFNENTFNPDKRLAGVTPVLTYCGKLSRAKGVPWMLKALRQLEPLPFHLHLVGNGTGEELEECFKLAEGLGRKVTLHGGVGQEDLAAILRQSHVFILPSLYEGLPLAVLEALACGCIVAVTDLPGCREILSDVDDGCFSMITLPELRHIDILPAAAETPFVEAIKSAVEDAIEKSQTNTRHYAECAKAVSKYSWKQVFRKIEQHYYQVLG